MKKFSRNVWFAAVLVLLGVSVAFGAGVGPEFTISGVSGQCKIKTPNSADFVAAEQGKTYVYGSVLKTGADSSAVVQFSEGNECQVMAGAAVLVGEDARDASIKRLGLEEGTIRVSLQETFHKNNGLQVDTGVALVESIGSKFSAGVRTDADIKMLVLIVDAGMLKVQGKHSPVKGFDVKILKAGDALSIATSLAKRWIRLKNVRGIFEVMLRGEDGGWREVDIEKEEVIKIVITESDDKDKYILTIMIVAADGKTVKEAWTVEIPKKDGKGKGPGWTPWDPDDFPTTTTTTTISSPTPVGDR